MPKVYNKRHKGVPRDAVYVGRPTAFGNPFTHLDESTLAKFRVKTREEAVERYKQWILGIPALVQMAKDQLRGKDLVCWCAPKPCHGDVLLEIANQE